MFAAYQKGAFNDIEPGLSFNTFADFIIHEFGQTEMYVGIAPNSESREHTEIPVGIFIVTRWHNTLGEPHTFWFPWATPRNKIEVTLKFLTEMRRDMTLLLFVREEFVKFFDRMKEYGVVRHCCKLQKIYPDGTGGRLYQSIE
jgi:hypothetical protein